VSRGRAALSPLPRWVHDGAVLAFGVDGLVQLAAVFVAPLLPLSMLTRTALVLGAPLLLFLFVVMRRVPWRLLLLVLCLAWQTGGMLPLPAVFLDLTWTGAVGSLVQLAVFGVVVLWGGLRVRDEDLGPGPEVAMGSVVGRGVAVAALGAAALVAQVWAVGWSLSLVTAGYAQADLDGLSMAHRSCSDGATTVHLVATVHIAEDAAYEALMSEVPDQALLLAEGVTDADGHLGKGFGYGKVAARLGLVAQRGEGDGAGSEGGGRFRVRQADVDVNTFHEETLRLLRDVGGILSADDPVKAYVSSITSSVGVTEEALAAVVDDVLLARNAHLLGELDAVRPDEADIAVPWGAMHMAGIHEAVVERGFSCGPPRYVRMIRWRTVAEALSSR